MCKYTVTLNVIIGTLTFSIPDPALGKDPPHSDWTGVPAYYIVVA